MRIGLVSTRLAGTDGVSLETAKWETVLRRMGHQTLVCAGELEPGRSDATLIAEAHFTHPPAEAASRAAFDPSADSAEVRRRIERLAGELLPRLRAWVRDAGVELLVVENAWAIPMQLPLGLALARLVGDDGLPAIGHHHDFAWERERFARCIVPDLLDEAFPPDAPSVVHAVINSPAAAELRRRRGIQAVVVPNVFDFEAPVPTIDGYNGRLRAEIGLAEDDLLVLQPTRVVPRKGIELAIELVARLHQPRVRLVVTHRAGDEGLDYLERLEVLAAQAHVDLRYVAERFDDRRATAPDGRRIFALWDAYPHADFVTYPSLYEGFGNALVETVYFRRPMLVNRYSVYDADIRPLGFRFVEIEGAVTDDAVERVRRLIADPAGAAADVEHNFELGRRHLSYGTLEDRLRTLLERAAGAA